MKRQRSVEIFDNVKKRIVQTSVLQKTKFLLIASATFLEFVYSQVVTKNEKQQCHAFAETYNQLLKAMKKNNDEQF